ncbi:beta-ketoacyl synthase N-terminal-like domain-containing protein, partial [Frankia sp. Cr1]
MSNDGGAQEIAVVGIGCRFPGAVNPAEFWQLLRSGVEAVTVFSA